MSGYILCQTKKAEKPYYIEAISTNIYSMEELCYYLYNNLYLVDNTILNEELCSWISEELELPALAAKLKPHLGKFASAVDIMYPIFKEINYLSHEELRVLNRKLTVMEKESILVRRKRRGDTLVENRMYVSAIRIYQELLGEKNLEQLHPGLMEQIYHNLGCASSYLFQMERALEYFEKEYACSKNEDALKTYLLAFRSMREQKEYEDELSRLGVSAEIALEIEKRLEEFAEGLKVEIDPEEIDEMLEDLTREYHRSTNS